jgi:hypothetical protein
MSNINVNVQYEYTSEIIGDFSGGPLPEGTEIPHPISVNSSGNTVTDLSAVTIGGVNGLNN